MARLGVSFLKFYYRIARFEGCPSGKVLAESRKAQKMPVFCSGAGDRHSLAGAALQFVGLFSIVLARLQAIKSVLVAFAGAKIRTIRHTSKVSP